jgi:predicted nucleic acid-binding Zn ribbon protein
MWKYDSEVLTEKVGVPGEKEGSSPNPRSQKKTCQQTRERQLAWQLAYIMLNILKWTQNQDWLICHLCGKTRKHLQNTEPRQNEVN